MLVLVLLVHWIFLVMIFFKVPFKQRMEKSNQSNSKYFFFRALFFFRVTKSGNEDLAVSLTDWVFKQRGVLRAKNIRHYLKKDKTTPSFYTIKNDIVFNVQFDEFVHGKWMPFNGTDVQLEFVRIDPFVRTTMKNKNGQLEAQFRVPDTYGIYKFIIDYNRVGYTHLFSDTQVDFCD